VQKDLVESQPLSGIEVGRESEEMCLLAKLFNGFANSTRLSILLLLAQRGEMKVGELVDRNAFYAVADERVMQILELGEELLQDNLEHVEACDDIEKGC
jgi:hypothetical protein